MINPANARNLLVAVAFVMAVPQAVASVPCATGERFFDLARQAGAEQSFDQAADWLRKSIDACPSYEAWHLLGIAEQKQSRLAEALQAFEQAASIAASEDQAALSIGRYGQVLALNGQRFEALTMLERAIETHSRPPSWMREDAIELDRSLADQPISGASIKRSLAHQEFGLLSLRAANRAAKSARTRVRIPLNFKFDSTELDELTKANLAALAQALADEDYDGKRFEFVGHTDVRGGWDYNLALSQQRAASVHAEIIGLHPALADRIRVRGAGESSPKYAGEGLSDEDHRLNRRLEVYVD